MVSGRNELDREPIPDARRLYPAKEALVLTNIPAHATGAGKKGGPEALKFRSLFRGRKPHLTAELGRMTLQGPGYRAG